MGKITQKSLPNKEIPKQKRRHRRKDLDDMHSRILKTKRKSVNEEEKCNKDRRSKQNSSKNSNKHIRPLYTGIFRNGTKSKNVKKDKNIKKGKLESVVSKARLVGDMLKLFDEDSGTICISGSSTEDEFTNKLPNNELVKNNSEGTPHALKKSPVISKNQMKYLEDTFKKNEEAEIVFEPIDIPEVVIDQNFDTKRTMKGKKRNEKKKEATHSEHSKITSYSWNLRDSYRKLCAKLSDEYENVLNCTEDPLSTARRKLKEISDFLRTKHTQHETVQELSNSKSSTLSVSEHQACTYSSDPQSLTVQFSKNRNNVNHSSENNQHNKKNLGNFNIDRLLSTDSNSGRDKRCFNISIIRDNNSKMPLKKRVLITSPHEELPTQLSDEEIITVDCNVPKNNIFQKYSKKMDRSGSTNEKFSEVDFASMFRNLPTPSTVNRQFYRSKEPEYRSKSINIKERFEESGTHQRTNISNRENEVVRFRDRTRPQAPLEVLTTAATFVEAGHLPQTAAVNLFTDKYIPISSNWCKSSNHQPSPFYCSQNAGFSKFNVKPTEQRHCASQNACRCEERHIYLNCSNCSHESNISQAHHQNHAETTRTIVAPGCSCFPIHYNSVASNYINPPNNVEHARLLPLVPKHDSYTCPQQVDDRQRMICLQNFTQPVKYFALDNGVNVHKVPLYVKDSICRCQEHGHSNICPQ